MHVHRLFMLKAGKKLNEYEADHEMGCKKISIKNKRAVFSGLEMEKLKLAVAV